MARDYAKRRPTRRILTAGVSTRGKKSGGSQRSGALKHLPYLLVGVVMGLVIAGFFYVKMQPLQVAHEDVSDEDVPVHVTKVKKAKVAHHKKAATVAHNNTQPHYDFYTMLTKEKGSDVASTDDTPADEESDEEEDNTSAKSKETTEPQDQEEQDDHIPAPRKTAATTTGKYVLQIASLKKQQDADRLKARLTLEGYDVSIHKQKIKNTVYYRVQAGPYQTAANAKCQQKRLQKCHIRSLLITA